MRGVRLGLFINAPLWALLIVSPFLIMIWLIWLFVVAALYVIKGLTMAMLWLFGAVRR